MKGFPLESGHYGKPDSDLWLGQMLGCRGQMLKFFPYYLLMHHMGKGFPYFFIIKSNMDDIYVLYYVHVCGLAVTCMV